MNIEQANTIPLSTIFKKLGIRPSRTSVHDAMYLSPLREEKTASFHVSHVKNRWFDHGIGVGGDTVKFGCLYLESRKQSHTVPDALKWLASNVGEFIPFKPANTMDVALKEKKLVVTSVEPLMHPALVDYLAGRGIPVKVASKILQEIRVRNEKKGTHFFALGLQNEEDAYELRNPFYKGCIGTKTISFIRGKIPKPDGIHLFEGFMDYLSAITDREGRPFDEDTIILNSLSCLLHITPYIKNYGYKMAYTWMDNDEAGKKATKALACFFKTEEMLRHIPMNGKYMPYKDVNAWHMQRLGLDL